MKVIILAAGQGKRLLPMTIDKPKSLLDIGGQTMIGWQVQELIKSGVDEIIVVTGFQAEAADTEVQKLQAQYPACRFKTFYNPEFDTADNLVSCWSVRAEMDRDFVLINGDTLFEAEIFQRLIQGPEAPITVTTDHKERYDEDDMKVRLEGTRLLEISKAIPMDTVDGESIGMTLYRGAGPKLFADTLDKAKHNPQPHHRWYLSVIDDLAKTGVVETRPITRLEWCEVDYPLDLKWARQMVTGWTVHAGDDDSSAVAP
ncbi:MAG: phosphocholine cytidylyltransferase family protein [Rhodospirillales bacterium]|nr:phosphocholine cytidylyltransferase family protein [Rhodospirillales bacterium]